jgi:hypothetical protein
MAEPSVREIGSFYDGAGLALRVGVDHHTVTIEMPGRTYRLTATDAEDFARMFISACWQAAEQAGRMKDRWRDD